MNLIRIMPILVLLVSGCLQAEEAQVTETEESTMPTETLPDNETQQPEPAETAEPGELHLGFIFSKDVYAVGEELDGNLTVSYSGEPFEGIVSSKLQRDGFDKTPSSHTKTTISETNSSIGLIAADIHGGGFSTSKSFGYAGTYTYTMKVYDCADVILEFGTCRLYDLDKDDLEEMVVPMGEYSESIQVIEN
jgi:hypothetical protein